MHAPQPDHSWNLHALTVASVAPAPSATRLNSSSIGIVFGTAAAAANAGNPKLKVPPVVPVMVTVVAGFAAVALVPV